MLKRVIDWSVANKFIVLVFAAFAAIAGVFALKRTPLEALPDLSDVQVILQTEYEGQAPQIVEDQVTFPIASEMLKVPGAQTVRTGGAGPVGVLLGGYSPPAASDSGRAYGTPASRC